MKFFLKYHLLTLLLGFLLAYLCLGILIKTSVLTGTQKTSKTVRGTVIPASNYFQNLTENESQELQLLASLREKSGITLFGSSELSSESQYNPYLFLPKTFNIRVNSFGRAFHQNLSIYCQLLAVKKELKNANICIILSPGWFEENGSHIEGFLEYARPNFLQQIIRDETISVADKKYLGEFLSKNYGLIENPNNAIQYLVNLYRFQSFPVLNKFFENRKMEISPIVYDLNLEKVQNQQKVNDFNFEKAKQLALQKFRLISANNKLFVSDSYFNEFIKKADGTIRKGHFDDLDANSNLELRDFEKVLKLLKSSNCKASFIMQPLNPYHYDNLSTFNPILKKIKARLEQEKIPFLNLFTSSKSNYVGGILVDIMHCGDYGWLEVDEFLYKTYAKK